MYGQFSLTLKFVIYLAIVSMEIKITLGPIVTSYFLYLLQEIIRQHFVEHRKPDAAHKA